MLPVCVLLAACGGGGGSSGSNGCFFTYPGGPPAQQSGPDPLLAQQWHLQNTGQNGGTVGEDVRAVLAWILQPAKGGSVRVAIVDDAIETVHEDLAPNLAAWLDYRPGAGAGSAPLPCEQDDDHGTKVAGIVLARDDNAAGGAGVAPRAQLGAYNPLSTNTNADIADALARDSAITGVYNNSWGSPDNGLLHAADASFVAAVRRGIDQGRGGRGSVYVFPAGNGGCYMVGPGGCAFDDNANFDGYVNQFGVIAACAVDDQGKAPVYAEPGANVLVCGPSGNQGRPAITTTAPANGYADVSGTSASTPMVSGVVALMLQERPDLTWRDVRLILARSARRNDPGDAGWVTSPGLPFNPKYGFGVADAEQAVLRARSWSSVGGSATLQRCDFTRATGLPIVDDNAAGRVDQIDASGCAINQIEFVEVSFSATHAFSGDLRIELTSPSGLVSVLATQRLCDANGDGIADDCGVYNGWVFGSVRHLDEPARGTWQLKVADLIAGDAGRWDSWSLTLWGR
ncbi:MAG: S8 family serine peptidase [Burkholderiaceae bacterium]|nr:S8 family serine peptidase [Burkholderiaceae bacterium]